MERKRAPATHEPATLKVYEASEAKEAVPLPEQHRWLAWV